MAAIVGAFTLLQVFQVQDLTELAERAGVDVVDLAGAVNSTGLAALDYLHMTGELAPPAPSFPASVMARVACIENKESGGANVPNRQGSPAGGVMQYMESTFRRGAAELGHPEWSRWVPWQARLVAAHDLLKGRRAQWTVGGC